MDFRLKFKIDKSQLNIFHDGSILSLGSCFSENIGSKLVNSGFDVDVNPFGVMFNPISVAQVLSNSVNKKVFTSKDLFKRENKFYSLQHHGSFSNEDEDDLLSQINKQQAVSTEKTLSTKTVLITFGSAWVYERLDTGEIVANCHKLPSTFFEKRLLSIDEIVDCYANLIREFSDVVDFIFTVSPVRHWKDGAIENTRSKSVLHLAIQELTIQFQNVHYFPSFEIIMDELRDYRFFKEDMLHPNQQAINYVWEKFSQSYFSTETIRIVREVERFNQFKSHKVLGGEQAEIEHEHKVKVMRESILKLLPNYK